MPGHRPPSEYEKYLRVPELLALQKQVATALYASCLDTIVPVSATETAELVKLLADETTTHEQT